MEDRAARPTVFEFGGGAPAFFRLAAAHHARCLADPVLSHPFSHLGHPDHVQRLAWYWAQVFGGPSHYTDVGEGQTSMMELHAGMGASDDLGDRFVECFVKAADDARLPDDPEFRQLLRDYMEWAVRDVFTFNPPGTSVPAGLPLPRWSWEGPQDRPAGRQR